MKEYIIDAKNRSLGRVASEVAAVLRGKSDPAFKPNKTSDVRVSVVNVDSLRITGNKLKDKEYSRYTGYPGGLRFESLDKAIKEKGMGYVFKKAVSGMLPKNKLYSQIIKNLIVK